jgi:hypothetical protein
MVKPSGFGPSIAKSGQSRIREIFKGSWLKRTLTESSSSASLASFTPKEDVFALQQVETSSPPESPRSTSMFAIPSHYYSNGRKIKRTLHDVHKQLPEGAEFLRELPHSPEPSFLFTIPTTPPLVPSENTKPFPPAGDIPIAYVPGVIERSKNAHC